MDLDRIRHFAFHGALYRRKQKSRELCCSRPSKLWGCGWLADVLLIRLPASRAHIGKARSENVTNDYRHAYSLPVRFSSDQTCAVYSTRDANDATESLSS